MPAKVIQIVDGADGLSALTDDGRIWMREAGNEYRNPYWREIDPPPNCQAAAKSSS